MFAAIGIAAIAASIVNGGDTWLLAAALYMVANIGFAGGNVFYESLLPHVARPNEVDRVSTAGYAIGYVGGGLLLAFQLAWITWPDQFGMTDATQASKAAFASVAGGRRGRLATSGKTVIRSVRTATAVSSAIVSTNRRW